jgi:hypothetical protein
MGLRFESEEELRRLAPELAARNARKLTPRARPQTPAPRLPGLPEPKESEARFQAWLLGRAHELGWRTAHFRTALSAAGRHMTPVAGDGKGFPDTVLLRGPRLVVAELKAARGSLTPEQVEWLAAWKAVPAAEVFTWRPKDRPQIEEVLA